uniref:magnesium chelatase subunit ChlI family protein n=1 Tax=Parasphingorhabdus sp. TaxID=2709688 RepID=UPI0035934A57
TKTDDRSKNWVLKPESEWVYTEVPAIVSVELWDECAGVVMEQRLKRKPPAKRTIHLFSGLVFCHCGTKMYVPSDSPKYTCQACRTKIPTADLEAIFHEQLKGFIFSEKEIATYLADHGERLTSSEGAVAALKREYETTKGESDKLYAAYSAGALDVTDFARHNEPWRQRMRELEADIPKAEATIDALKVSFQSQEEIIREARDLHMRWPELTPDQKRQIVEAIVERITIHPDEVEIDLYYSPDSGTPTGTGGGGPPSISSPLLTDRKLATRACRCGHLGDATLACSRAPRCAADYQAKVSGPLLDRIDLHIEVEALSAADLTMPPPAEGSAAVATRVARARSIQTERYADVEARTNTEIDGDVLEKYATPDEPGRILLAQAAAAMRLTARGYTRVLRVSRTIADLAGAKDVGRIHVAEALSYRRQPPRA